MGKGAPVSIAGALQETLQAQGLGFLLLEQRLRKRWRDVVGEKAESIAELDSLQDGVLRIRVADAAWRNELLYQCDALRQRANHILGGNASATSNFDKR